MILRFSHSISPMFHYHLSTMKMEMAKLDWTNAQIQRGGRAKRPNHRTTKVKWCGASASHTNMGACVGGAAKLSLDGDDTADAFLVYLDLWPLNVASAGGGGHRHMLPHRPSLHPATSGATASAAQRGAGWATCTPTALSE